MPARVYFFWSPFILNIVIKISARYWENFLLLFLSNWYCRKLGLTDLPAHRRKVMSDKKIICYSYWGYKGRNRDYCSHFSVIFQKQVNLWCFSKIDIGKSRVDRFTGSRREIDIRYEFGFELIWKISGCK